jgi:hypothetical protein
MIYEIETQKPKVFTVADMNVGQPFKLFIMDEVFMKVELGGCVSCDSSFVPIFQVRSSKVSHVHSTDKVNPLIQTKPAVFQFE